MKKELKAYLDGELDREELSPDLRAEAEAWDVLSSEMRALDATSAPGWLEQAIMTEVALSPLPVRREGWATWLLRPRPIRVSPLAGALATAALLTVAFFVGGDRTDGLPLATGPTDIFVEFSLEAPNATSVAVAGDFNGWEGGFVLEDRDGDGVWSGRVALRPGVHRYMFILDGDEWVTDPKASRFDDDGFGNRNAVIAVTPPPAA